MLEFLCMQLGRLGIFSLNRFIKGDFLQILMSAILFSLWVAIFISSRDSLVLKRTAGEH